MKKNAFIFVSISFLCVTFFTLLPLLYSFGMTFFSGRGNELVFSGFDNYTMVDELLSIFARFEDYDGIHHFATQALNLVPENVKAQYWLVYSIYHSGVVALAKREIEKAKCRLTSEEFDTLQKFICKDESLPYGQLFD